MLVSDSDRMTKSESCLAQLFILEMLACWLVKGTHYIAHRQLTHRKRPNEVTLIDFAVHARVPPGRREEEGKFMEISFVVFTRRKEQKRLKP